MSACRRIHVLWLPSLLLLLAAGGCSSPERRIAQRLEHLMELAEKDGEESALAAAGRAREMVELFADGFEVIAAPLDFRTSDRARLTRTIVGYRRSSERITVRLSGRETNVDPAAGRATTLFTAEFDGAGPSLSGRDAYRFRFSWIEGDDGEWRIDQAELLAVTRAGGLRSLLGGRGATAS